VHAAAKRPSTAEGSSNRDAKGVPRNENDRRSPPRVVSHAGTRAATANCGVVWRLTELIACVQNHALLHETKFASADSLRQRSQG
jgi:hypothetical protein